MTMMKSPNMTMTHNHLTHAPTKNKIHINSLSNTTKDQKRSPSFPRKRNNSKAAQILTAEQIINSKIEKYDKQIR